MKYELYTDGSCSCGIGGWAAVIVAEGKVLQTLSGHAFETTNNRMELTGIIEGLKKFHPKMAVVEVLSDSAYIINCFKQKWYVNWRIHNWMGTAGPVKNKDLWMELLALVEAFKTPVTFTFVKGHNGNKFNSIADLAASEARKMGEANDQRPLTGI
jgi:ribonuclease HI